MVTRCCTFINEHLVPNFSSDQGKTVYRETSEKINFSLDKLYLGPLDYRYQGKEGSDFLRSKSFYGSNNYWELGRSLLVYSLLAAVGYLLFQASFVWLGYGLIAG